MSCSSLSTGHISFPTFWRACRQIWPVLQAPWRSRESSDHFRSCSRTSGSKTRQQRSNGQVGVHSGRKWKYVSMKNPKRTCTAAVSGSVRNIDRTLSFDIVSSSIIFFFIWAEKCFSKCDDGRVLSWCRYLHFLLTSCLPYLSFHQHSRFRSPCWILVVTTTAGSSIYCQLSPAIPYLSGLKGSPFGGHRRLLGCINVRKG